MSLMAGEVYDRQRGADGFFPPHSNAETCALIEKNVRHIAGQKPTMHSLRDSRMFRWYLMPDEALSMGPRLYWIVSDADGTIIAAGLFERDLDFEEEHAELTGEFHIYWIAQSACVYPCHQRRGIYTMLLRETHRLTGVPLLPDTQQTYASAGVWANLLGADTAS